MPDMTEDWQIQNQVNKKKWFLGNQDAVDFVNSLFYAVELWDDLIDKDTKIEADQINATFFQLMFALPANPWFHQNKAYYLPLIMQSINGFHDSNILCNSRDKKLRNLAFHIRNLGIEIHIATAYLIGGYDHMRRVSLEIREFFAFETFEDWDKKHG